VQAIILLAVVALLLALSMRGSSRRRKQTQALQQSMEPGVRVMTTSGIYGIVTEVETDTIVLEISAGVEVRFAKAAVLRVVPEFSEDGVIEGADEDDESGEAEASAESTDAQGPHDAAGSDAARGDAAQTGDAEASTDASPDATAPVDAAVDATAPRSASDADLADGGHQPSPGSVATT
jgi:preprotein translocase subunit YajC